MRSVLFLVHRIPYPPDKGDKIRSHHLLRYLSRHYRVHLGAFVDDPFDKRYEGEVARFCASSCLVPLNPRLRKLASLPALLGSQALSLPYYRSRQLQAWVDATVQREAIDTVLVFSSTMAPYVADARFRSLNRIADFVDVDSDKWAQYAERTSGVRAWLYRREARALACHERKIAGEFDATLLVTQAEADLFRRIAPECASRVDHVDNGVDTDYFDPALPLSSPYAEGGPVMVFTGAMDYWPNAQAVQWFADEVLPLVRQRQPDVRFAIVGSKPGADVLALGRRPGILVTGRVPDVRPYLRFAAVAVAPLQIARGIQNKVLEALAMACPLVCSGPAAEGLRAAPELARASADTPAAFADKVLERLTVGTCPEHRAFVIAHYSWESQLAKVGQLIDRGPRPAPNRLIVYASLFPSAAAPAAGVFIRERMFRVARHLPVVVIAPQAWSPFDWLIRRFRTSFRPMGPAFEQMDGIAVHRPRFLSLPGVFKRLDGWLMARGTEACVRRVQADFGASLIDAHFLYPDGWAATRIGARLGLPVTITLRGSKDEWLIGTDRERFLREALAAARHLFSVSDALKRDVGIRLGAPADKITVIGNGVDLDRFSPTDRAQARARLGIAAQAPVLIGVGGLIERKGFHRLIALLPGLRRAFPDLVYLIVGGGTTQSDMRESLEALTIEHGVSDMVRFCGPQSPADLRWFYGAADVFTLATSHEGWANVFLEAMACGLPVVTTRVGGNAEVVCEPGLGTLVDYWDAPAFSAALAEALRRAWDRHALVAYARSNSWEPRIARLLTVFEQIDTSKGAST